MRERVKAAVFVDAENLHHGPRQETFAPVLGNSAPYDAVAKRAYANWKKIGEDAQGHYGHLGFDLVQCWHAREGKDSADMQLAIEAIELAINTPDIRCFIIFTGDSDFVPLIKRLRTYGKEVVVHGHTRLLEKLTRAGGAQFRWVPGTRDDGGQDARRGDKPPARRPAVEIDEIRRRLVDVLESFPETSSSIDDLALARALPNELRSVLNAMKAPVQVELWRSICPPSVELVRAARDARWWFIRLPTNAAAAPEETAIRELHRMVSSMGRAIRVSELRELAAKSMREDVTIPKNGLKRFISRSGCGYLVALGDAPDWEIAAVSHLPIAEWQSQPRTPTSHAVAPRSENSRANGTPDAPAAPVEPPIATIEPAVGTIVKCVVQTVLRNGVSVLVEGGGRGWIAETQGGQNNDRKMAIIPGQGVSAKVVRSEKGLAHLAFILDDADGHSA